MRTMERYLARAEDDVVQAARLYCWDLWHSGHHPVHAEESAARAFALTRDEQAELRGGWGPNPGRQVET